MVKDKTSYVNIELKPYNKRLIKSLKKIKRTRNLHERHKNLVDSFLSNGAAELINVLTNELSEISVLDNINYIFHYTETGFALGHKDTFRSSVTVGPVFTIYRSWYERELTSEESSKNRSLIFNISMKTFQEYKSQQTKKRVLMSSVIFSNDNKDGNLRQVE